jgi:transcriptional regulator with XRE-family HTH domain
MEQDEAIYRALLKEIRIAMFDKGVTQDDLAAALRDRGHDARRETVSGYLGGKGKKGMPTTVLISVADILGVDLGELTRRAIERAEREG